MTMEARNSQRNSLIIEVVPSNEAPIVSTRWTNFARIDGPCSWIMCVVILTSCLILYGCSSTYGILFPSILKEFKSGKAVTAIPGALALANSGLLGPITGRFYDHFGCFWSFLVGGVLSIIGLVSSSFAPNIAVLILTFGMVFGLGLSTIYLCTLLVIPLFFDKYIFQARTVVSVGPGAALLVMSPVVQNCYHVFGWRNSLLCMAATSFSACLVGCSMYPKKDGHNSSDEGQTQQGDNANNCAEIMNCSVFKSRVYVLTATMVTITSLGHTMPFVHLAKYCDDLGIESNRSSWIYFTIGLSSLLCRLLIGKYGNNGFITLPHIYQSGAYILAVGNVLLPLLKKYYLLVLYGVVYGIGEGLTFTPTMHMVMNSLPEQRRGAGYGLYVFFVSLSYALGPVLSGLIADGTGSYSFAFYTAGALEFVGASLQFLERVLSKSNIDDIPRVEKKEEELYVALKETVL